MDFPWIWAFILGSVFCAVSPAVVVPSMIRLEEKRLGTDEGIPTLLIAACSLNDVIAISLFTIVLGIAFSQADLAYSIAHGPLEAILGIAFGLVMGVLQWYIPPGKHEHLIFVRFVLLAGGGLLGVFGSRQVHFPGAGALGCLVMAYTAGYNWRMRGWTDGKHPMVSIFGFMWRGLFQPLLFGLIGAEIDVLKLEGGAVAYGCISMLVALAVRMVITFFCTFGRDYSLKEKFFFPFAWMPKATVQAAIGPVALDMARKHGDAYEQDLGMQVLSNAVLSILITAPIGATLIALLAPRFLKVGGKRDIDEKEPSKDQKSLPENGSEEDLNMNVKDVKDKEDKKEETNRDKGEEFTHV